MAADLTIKYQVDSVEGNSLSTTVASPDHGWVEYCNQRGQVFYSSAMNNNFYKKCHEDAIDLITKYVVEDNRKNLGFVHHLSNVLINDEFVMPMFAVVPTGTEKLKITAGTSRMIASMMNGYTARDLKTVAFTPIGRSPTQLENVKPLTSTANFEKIYNLSDIDYEIAMSDSAAGDMSAFRFDRSVLRHSVYDKKDQALPHTLLGTNILSYWAKHRETQNKIHLNIRCTPEVENLIQPSTLFTYDVMHEKNDEWQWSYGKILGAYRKTEVPLGTTQIHLWLYDVTEPVYLELLLPWITGQYTCCHTKNKKALFFDTSSDVTSMQIIGDWVN